jgi:hypothetical protein
LHTIGITGPSLAEDANWCARCDIRTTSTDAPDSRTAASLRKPNHAGARIRAAKPDYAGKIVRAGTLHAITLRVPPKSDHARPSGGLGAGVTTLTENT